MYTQPPGFSDDVQAVVNATTQRTSFNVSAFADTLGLGNPIAGNFFLTGPSNSSGEGLNISTGGVSSGSLDGKKNIPKATILLALATAVLFLVRCDVYTDVTALF